MPEQLRTVAQTPGADTLLVLLPGAYMTAEDYAARFFPAVERRGMKLDLVAVDLGLDAVSAGDALPAVLEQILRPSRQTHRRVWLGGISLGGLLALGLTADHPGAIDGLCLIAPYPGSRLTTNAIVRAGGLDVWQPSAEQLADPEFRIYRWLKSPPAELPVFVGYGREDRFAEGMQAIAGRFPPVARHPVSGDHDWPAWCVLWEHFLDSGILGPRSQPAPA
jgi:pimeloyl-ACP methyl ester carboxylesterase